MAPFEALYRRPCRSPLCWNEVGKNLLLGPDLVRQSTEVIGIVCDHLKIAQSHQKSYIDRRR